MKRFRRPILLSRSAVTAGLAIAFALLVGVAALTAFSTHRVAAADRRAIEADRTLTAATRVLATLGETESAAEGYTTSADQNFLPAYAKSREHLVRDFTALRQQLERRSRPTALLTELQGRMLQKLQAMQRAVQATSSRGGAVSPAAAERAESARLSEDIRELVHALQRQEFAAVADESAAAVARARTVQTFNVALLVLAAGLTLGGGWLLLWRMRELDSMITICAWTQRVRWQGRWVTFEDYLAKRFHVFCTHGICDEAAAKIRGEMTDDEPAGLPRR